MMYTKHLQIKDVCHAKVLMFFTYFIFIILFFLLTYKKNTISTSVGIFFLRLHSFLN